LVKEPPLFLSSGDDSNNDGGLQIFPRFPYGGFRPPLPSNVCSVNVLF